MARKKSDEELAPESAEPKVERVKYTKPAEIHGLVQEVPNGILAMLGKPEYMFVSDDEGEALTRALDKAQREYRLIARGLNVMTTGSVLGMLGLLLFSMVARRRQGAAEERAIAEQFGISVPELRMRQAVARAAQEQTPEGDAADSYVRSHTSGE